MSVTRYTLTNIEGERMEDLFSGRWNKRLPMYGDGRVFLYVNINCFLIVAD